MSVGLVAGFFGPSEQISETETRSSADCFKSNVLGSNYHKVHLSILQIFFFNSEVFNGSRVIFEITTYGTFWPERLSAAEVNV